MAHFAQLDENNNVLGVIVVRNEDILDENGNESEQIGIDFCKNHLGEETRWVQTSYNSNFRKKYASIGDYYDESFDAFIPLQPFPSWTLNTKTLCWDPPIPYPDLPELDPNEFGTYFWNEENYQEDPNTAWVLEKRQRVSLY